LKDVSSLVDSVRQGSRLALGRLLTQVENDTEDGRQALVHLFRYTGGAHLIGVTGAPGTGKSSLVNRLAFDYRHPPSGIRARRVGIIAVDPSSPFTGGAILGDRVRMRDLAGDPGVFIRSMASRGTLGGLAATTYALVDVMDAAGFDIILIETVGAGQGEVDVASLAHTTLVVEAPGLGDDIQAIKAGILEIADILVINKADLPGVENTERALRGLLQFAHPATHHPVSSLVGLTSRDDGSAHNSDLFWEPPVLCTVATDGHGISDLVSEIDHHREYLEKSGDWRKQEHLRLESQLDHLLKTGLLSRWRMTVSELYVQSVVDRLIKRELSPWQAVEMLLSEVRE
jgi:LAO/AO transport system kinase